MKTVRIAAAQTPEIRGDIPAALNCLGDFATRAEAEGARLLCFPEGFLQGYLLDEASAHRVALDLSSLAFDAVLRQFPKTGPTLVVGMIEAADGHLFNTAVVVKHGKLVDRYRKVHLLGGEKVFEAGKDQIVLEAEGMRFGINICYDTNFRAAAQGVADLGASLIVCSANNMMPRQKAETYRNVHNAVRGERCRETGLWLISSDVTGERDGQIAWGPTAVIDPEGQVVAQLPLEAPGLLLFDLPV